MSASDCFNNIMKAYGISIDDIMADPIAKAEFEFASKVIDQLHDEAMSKVGDAKDNFDKILNDKNFTDYTKRVMLNTQKKYIEKIDMASKSMAFVNDVMRNNPDAKSLGRKLVQKIRSMENTKQGNERRYNAEFYSHLANHPDKDIASQSIALYKSLGKQLFNTEAKKAKYENVMRAIIHVAHNDKEGLKKIFPDDFERATVEHLANSLMNIQRGIIAHKKNSGMIIGQVDNYLWKRTYDRNAIFGLGPEGLAKLLEDNLDHGATFASGTMQTSPDARTEYFKNLWQTLNEKSISGMSSEDAMSAVIANSTKSRQFVFKNADAEFNVMKAIGGETDLHTLIQRDLADSASVVSHYLQFGASSERALQNSLLEISKQLSKADLPSGDKKLNSMEVFRGYADQAKQDLKVLTIKPKTNFSTLGHAFSFFRNMNVAKLGATVVTQAPLDMISLTHTTMADRGMVNAFDAFASSIKTFSKVAKLDEKARLELQRSIGVFNNIHDSTAVVRMAGDTNIGRIGDAGPKGYMALASEKMGQISSSSVHWSGLGWMTDMHMTASGVEASSSLALAIRAHKDGNLSKSYARVLSDAGFTSKEVAILAENFDKVKGFEFAWDEPDKFLNPLKIYEVADEAFGKNASAQKEALVNKTIGFINDRTRQGAPMPSIFDNVGRGKEVLGDADAFVNMITMFKGTLMNMTDAFIKRNLAMHRNMGGGELAGYYATYMAGSMGMFLATDTISSFLLDRESAYHKFARGDTNGALLNFLSRTSPVPIMTDPMFRLFEQKDKWGQSVFADVALGPAGGLFRDLENVYKSKDVGKAMLRFTGNHLIPYTSNWMVRGAGRHLLGIDPRSFSPVKKNEFIKGSLLNLGE